MPTIFIPLMGITSEHIVNTLREQNRTEPALTGFLGVRTSPLGGRAAIVRTHEGRWSVEFMSVFSNMQKNIDYAGGVMQFEDVDDLLLPLNTFLFSDPCVEGERRMVWINQGWRACVVTSAKRSRFRLGYLMPKAGGQGGWRRGVNVCGHAWYPPSFANVARDRSTAHRCAKCDYFLWTDKQRLVGANFELMPKMHFVKPGVFLCEQCAMEESHEK